MLNGMYGEGQSEIVNDTVVGGGRWFRRGEWQENKQSTRGTGAFCKLKAHNYIFTMSWRCTT